MDLSTAILNQTLGRVEMLIMVGHAFLLSVIWFILCSKTCTFSETDNHKVCISESETWRCVFQMTWDNFSTVVESFCSDTGFNPCSASCVICIAKPDFADGLPRDLLYFNKNNEFDRIVLVNGILATSFKIKKKWSKCIILYYPNCVASFNFLELSIELIGDVHPMPGPVNTNIRWVPVHISSKKQCQPFIRSRNPANCTNVKIMRQSHLLSTAAFRMCLLNVRSVRNKGLTVKDFTVDHDLDALIITETWLRPGNEDMVEIGTLYPTGYRFLHVPQYDNTTFGGGIGFLFKETLDINSKVCDNFETFEVMDVLLKSIEDIRILCVYRLPNERSYALIYDEFSRLFERTLTEHSGCLLIAGDFNFHIDEPQDNHANRFIDILDAFGLKQHVSAPTHNKGHTLDLLITRSEDSLISRIMIRDPIISDHFAVHCDLGVQKPKFSKKKVTFRKLRSIDIDSLYEDIGNSNPSHNSHHDLNTLVENYDRTLSSILDKHAPILQREVIIRPPAPWYNQEVALEKNKRRRLERKWRTSKLLYDRQQYVYQCSVVNKLINNLKTAYYREVIKEHSGDQKVLFTTVNKLLQKESVKRYSPSPDSNVLVNSFADFFAEKIDKIHSELMQKQAIVCPIALITSSCCQFEFSDFTVVSQDTIRELTHKLALKSCNLDPLPASLMKPDCLDLLLPTITKIVNISLSSGVMPEALKVAELLPALKKPGANYKQF